VGRWLVTAALALSTCVVLAVVAAGVTVVLGRSPGGGHIGPADALITAIFAGYALVAAGLLWLVACAVIAWRRRL